ncbi:glycosyl transferase [Nitrospira sp. KM1]|uniref:glycosyltransferase family 2 protein n=1 Tax=Nitrospira sp. KM1 TaxID=1936990 RepID=UPI0013A77A3D|nr:glycosyltransferase family 2 protein [Nitrospira sp. KM1]BCA54461.1 glycosyl transferase [Nitrospira sp. KM1]
MTMWSEYPSLSIVTPSFNQGQFLEDAIQSVLVQQYPNLEYVVMDGGSSDGSVDTIRKYESRLTYWHTGRDDGQYDAINKGFVRTSGDIMGWLNSDDKYTPWTFSVVADIFRSFPQVEWITTVHPQRWNERGQSVHVDFTGGFSSRAFLKGSNFPVSGSYGKRWIQQESTFWRRSLWERAGGRLDPCFKAAGDFDLWARFFEHAELYGVDAVLGGFRVHGDQRSVRLKEQYMAEAERVLCRYGQWPCQWWEGAMRSFLWKLLRTHSMVRLPEWSRQLFHKTGLFYPAKVAVWTGKDWEIITAFAL